MGTNLVSDKYNATGFTLTFGSGNKTLASGINSFRLHFQPAGQGIRARPWGAQSDYQGYCDRLGIRGGDFLYLTELDGETILPPRKFLVTGMADYPSQLLAHQVLGLAESRS